jgi:hypothetical protein
MTKFSKTYWIFGLLIVLIICGVSYLLLSNKSQLTQIKNTGSFPTTNSASPKVTPGLTPAPTSTPTPTPSVKQLINTSTAVPAGPPQGQIICNYQIPVGPNTYGTADIKANWNNLIVGKNGSVQATVCVAASTQASTLMTLSDSMNSSWENSVPWLAPNVNYTFTLYDDHGGDLANCAGAVLSSCQVHAMLPSIRPSGQPGRP